MAEENPNKARSAARRRLMLEGNLLRVIPLIAFPQVVSMLIDAIYNLADTFFVSRLGPAATAAVGVNDSLMHVIRALSLAFGMGAASYISRLLGAGRDEDASRAASTTVFTAMGFIALLAVTFYSLLSPLVSLLGATESAKPYSMDYARWTLLFSPFTAGTVCLSQSLRGEGSTVFAMCGSVSGCVINVFLDPLFISVLGWGVAGAAIATGFSKVISFCILLYPYLARKCVLYISPRLFTPKKALYSEIARMGIPVGLRTSMMTVSTIIINNVAGGFGDMALAAVAVANKCMRLVASALIGFGQGFQPVCGYNYGAGLYGRVKKAFWFCLKLSFCILLAIAVAVFIFAPEIIALFRRDDSEVIRIGALSMRLQALSFPLTALVVLSNMLMQTIGKSFKASVLALSRQGLFLLPFLFILAPLLGLLGVQLAQPVSDACSFVLAIPLVRGVLKEMRT